MSVTLRSIAPLILFAVLAGGCGTKEESNERSSELSLRASVANDQPSTKSFGVTIRKPSGPPRVSTGILDSAGNPVLVSCTTCHATRPPNEENRTSEDMDEFHQGIPLSHGSTSCLSCHNSRDYDSLALSDGRRVEFSDVMTLCAQCHGTQMRDYENGAHGGMNGYWDLKRGPRTRNNCVDCHDPHSPRFPHMVPTFRPVDRFLDQHHDETKDDHE